MFATWGTTVDKRLSDLPRGKVLLDFQRFVRQALKSYFTAFDYGAGINLIAVENYAYGRIQRAHDMGELGGVFRLEVSRLLASVTTQGVGLVVAPTVAKRFVAGDSHAQKTAVREAVLSRFGIRAKSADEGDAAAIALFVRSCWKTLLLQGTGGDEYVSAYLTKYGLDRALFT